MALRFFLVALVAALGLELPSSQQVSHWSHAGHAWISARLDDLSGSTLVAENTDADEHFDLVVSDLTASFSADLAELSQPKPKLKPVFEPIAVPDLLYTGIAYQLNAQAGGEGFATDVAGPPEAARWDIELVLVGPPANLAVASGELVGPPVEIVSVPRELVGPPGEQAAGTTTSEAETAGQYEASRSNRLVSAFRLTRQAAQAWMTLLSDSDGSNIRR